jgi:ribosome-binding protein aMBF1 (putative translation factor)
MDCFICGAKEEDGVVMHKVISDTEIVNVCDKCIKQTSLPRIKKSSDFDMEKVAKQDNWRDRVNKQIDQKQSFKIASNHGLTLRDVVERKMNPSLSEKVKPKVDLIKNFNWEVLRARKQLRLTQMKLGTAVGESEFTIRMLERGVVPENYHILIQRLEDLLKIKLFTEEYRKMNAPIPELTIGDVKEAQSEVPQPYWRRVMGKIFSKRTKTEVVETTEVIQDGSINTETSEISIEESEFENAPKENPLKDAVKKKELSSDEINKMIFGSKKR